MKEDQHQRNLIHMNPKKMPKSKFRYPIKCDDIAITILWGFFLIAMLMLVYCIIVHPDVLAAIFQKWFIKLMEGFE